jgi:hypothetical protein
MITIRITNAQQLILEKKGWFMANIVGAVVDLELQVEAIVAERVRASLAQRGRRSYRRAGRNRVAMSDAWLRRCLRSQRRSTR